jgi:hypothetical protein
MKDEADKRKQYSESRRKNKMKKKDDEHMINISESYVTHMENENEDEIININKDKNISKNAKSKKEETELVFISNDWQVLWEGWVEHKRNQFKDKYKTKQSEQIAINQLVELAGGELETAQEIVKASVSNLWKGLFKLKTNNNVTTFTGNKPSNADIYKQRREEMHRIAAEIDRQRGIRH